MNCPTQFLGVMTNFCYQKSYSPQLQESFHPQKFSTIRYYFQEIILCVPQHNSFLDIHVRRIAKELLYCYFSYLGLVPPQLSSLAFLLRFSSSLPFLLRFSSSLAFLLRFRSSLPFLLRFSSSLAFLLSFPPQLCFSYVTVKEKLSFYKIFGYYSCVTILPMLIQRIQCL